jgi:hypothetical protein
MRTFIQMSSFGFIAAVGSMVGGTSRRGLGTRGMLLHHRLRVAAARSTTVLLWELVMLLRRSVMPTLVWLGIRPSHRSHWIDVSGLYLGQVGLTYLSEVASGTSGELAHRAACTSLGAAGGAPVASPDGSSSVRPVLGLGIHWYQVQASGQDTEDRRDPGQESTFASEDCPASCMVHSKVDLSSCDRPLLVLEG